MKINNPIKKIESVYADWKDTDLLLDDLKVQLKKFGVNLYFDPNTEGTDMYGVILSKSKLSKKELKDYSNQTEIHLML